MNWTISAGQLLEIHTKFWWQNTLKMKQCQTRTFSEGGDRVVVPWYQRGGTWYKIVQLWWNLVPNVGVPVPSLYVSVPLKFRLWMFLEFLEQILAFSSADSDTDATVMWSGVVWSCPLASPGTDVDLLSEFVIFMINSTILIISY